jgi:hypothetical protein
MKDLELEAERRMQNTKMHDYKGFTVEPICGGFNIVMYGVKNILYVGGPGGWRLTEDMRQARAFRDPKTCHALIDEVISDWQGWVQSFGGKKSIVNLNQPQQQQVVENAEAIRQQQQQGVVM